MERRGVRYTFGQPVQQKFPSQSAASEHKLSLAETIRQDFFEEMPMWPLTCYAPHGSWMTEVGEDRSYEELRYEELRLIKVERRKRDDVVMRTRQTVENARNQLQQYLRKKSPEDNERGWRPITARSSQVVSPSGFGSAEPYLGSFGPKASRVDLRASPMEVEPPSDRTLARLPNTVEGRKLPTGTGKPPNENEDPNNPWLAAEFTNLIPEQAPPEKYIY